MTPTFMSAPRHYARAEFRDYVQGLTFAAWKPLMPYHHNTGVPSLAQWLGYGATPQERWGANLDRYYRGLGWHAGPHAVACPDYIWVLCDFIKPGVAQSCSNSLAWAIEQVGNFEIGGDDYATGAGARVRDNACFATAVMAEKLGWGDLADFSFNERGLHFHRDCKQDHHACPGSKVAKPDVLARIAAFRAELRGAAPAKPIALPAVPTPPEYKAAPAMNTIEDLQSALNVLKIAPWTGPGAEVDGWYGDNTIARMRLFQAMAGCKTEVWGWAGPETKAALVAALEKAAA